MRDAVKLISSGLYLGYSPIAPGTIGSIFAVLLYLILGRFTLAYVLLVVIFFIAGFVISGSAEDIFGKKDSQKIIIDEIAAMSFIAVFVKPIWTINLGSLPGPQTLIGERWGLLLGLVLFRIFDIVKPPPIKQVETISGSAGIMLDDIIAAFYCLLVLFVINMVIRAGTLLLGYI